ncbi:MAG: glycosyltransferase [Bacteroidales bacterium]|nr:glycosyltransferase [Bacteroidales bacterium]
MENIYTLLFYVAIIAAIAQLFLILFFYIRLFFYKPPNDFKETYPPVSVVISARNEHRNLIHFLPAILQQDYPDFEVVVVNDQSTDDTEFYLKNLQQSHANLKVVHIKNPINFFKGKKFPLSIGIKSASNELLLLTDADCQPATNQWIKQMTLPYQNEQTRIVLGYGAYKARGGLLNLIIRFETIKTAMQYFSFALAGMPYMGIGRNLSYKKSLFYEQHGFQNHYTIESGDDDLFVNKAAKKSNTQVVITPDSKTISLPKTTITNWIHQKKRHLTAGRHYKSRDILLLSVNDLSFFLLIVFSIILLVNQQHIILISVLLFLRYVLYYGAMFKLTRLVDERKIFLISPLLETILAVIIPGLSFLSIFSKRSKWK